MLLNTFNTRLLHRTFDEHKKNKCIFIYICIIYFPLYTYKDKCTRRKVINCLTTKQRLDFKRRLGTIKTRNYFKILNLRTQCQVKCDEKNCESFEDKRLSMLRIEITK